MVVVVGVGGCWLWACGLVGWWADGVVGGTYKPTPAQPPASGGSEKRKSRNEGQTHSCAISRLALVAICQPLMVPATQFRHGRERCRTSVLDQRCSVYTNCFLQLSSGPAPSWDSCLYNEVCTFHLESVRKSVVLTPFFNSSICVAIWAPDSVLLLN